MATSPKSDWRFDLPYRALVHIRDDHNGIPLYSVAGSAAAPCKASKALKAALTLHGGRCFYCEADGAELGAHFTIDHVDAQVRGGKDLFHNLVVACAKCNRDKGALPAEAFRPDAGRAWLLGVQAMIRARLALMQD